MKRILALVVALGCGAVEARAQGAPAGSVRWNRVDVVARLDARGGVEIEETHDLSLQGDVTDFQRSLNFAADQRAEVQAVYEVDLLGVTTTFRKVDDRSAHTYMSYGWGVQIFVRGEKDAWIPEGTRRWYVIRYALKGGISPAWDIPAGPGPLDREFKPRDPFERLGETLIAWSDAWPGIERLHRIDHDVVFPTSGSSDRLPQLSYRFEYDRSWELLDPNRDMGVATPEVDYRVQRLLRFLPQGSPSESSVRNAATRLGAAFAPVVVGVALTLLFLLFDRVLGRKAHGTRELFEERIGTLHPALVRVAFELGGRAPRFDEILLRLAARRKAAITVEKPETDDRPAETRARITTGRDKLPPFEREVIERVFGDRDDLATEEIQRGVRGSAFDPDLVVSEIFARMRPTPGPPRSRRMWSTLHFLLLASGVVFLIKGLAEGFPEPVTLLLAIIPGHGLATVWPVGTAKRRLSPFWIVVGVVLIGLLALGVPFFANRPPDATSAFGAMLTGIAHCVRLLARLPKPDQNDREHEAAARWALAELERPRPALRDEWVEAIEAMGGGGALRAWRRRHGGAMAMPQDLSEMGSADLNAGPPFTGEAPAPPNLPSGWAEGFTMEDGSDD